MFRILTRSLLFTLIFLAGTTIALGSYIYERTQAYENRIYPNVLVNGVSFDKKSREDIEAYYEKPNEKLKNLTFTIRYKDDIATFSGETIKLHYDSKTIADKALIIGRSPDKTSQIIQIISTFLHLHTYTFVQYPYYELDAVSAFIQDMDDAISVPAQNALFEFKNGKVTSFQVEKPGIQVNRDETLEAVKKYVSAQVNDIKPGKEFILATKPLQPDVTIKEINTFGIEELIGEGRSNYRGSSAEREYNLSHAAKRIHGVLVPPGGIFSYNKTVGDISQATGFKQGLIISNGRTVLGDGGGVCQDSTTLFRAALDSGLPIIERHAHAYRVHYYENDRKPGFDATVFAPSVDFKFKNDTPSYILIQVSNNHTTKDLVFSFYGKKDGRTVELSDATIYDTLPAPEPLYETTPDLPTGVTKQVDWSAPGAKSVFSYKVKSAKGEILQDTKFYSVFRPWRAIYQVGQ